MLVKVLDVNVSPVFFMLALGAREKGLPPPRPTVRDDPRTTDPWVDIVQLAVPCDCARAQHAVALGRKLHKLFVMHLEKALSPGRKVSEASCQRPVTHLASA